MRILSGLRLAGAANLMIIPTCAVVDSALQLLGGRTDFTVRDTPEAIYVDTSELTLMIGKSPFSLNAYRADGQPCFRSVTEVDGTTSTYASLNDEFIITRRCQRGDAFYGLGEKSGNFNRAGVAYTLWNTDVLDPRVGGDARAKLDANDPRADPRSTVFDPYYVSIPFFYHQSYLQPAIAGFFLDNSYRAHFDFTKEDEFTIRFEGGQYTEYVFAGP